jgi:putative oxidoreductase
LIAESAAKKKTPCIEDFLEVIDLIDAYARSHPYRSWYAIPLRLTVGFGLEHGYAKIACGPENCASILQALGVPAPDLLAWLTIFIELFGGLAVFVGASIPLVSIPMAIILLVAIFTVHVPNGFSSIKLLSVNTAGPHFSVSPALTFLCSI